MKTKRNKKLLAITMLIAVISLYGLFPLPNMAKAVDSIRDASDTLSDSDISATSVTHTFDFLTTTAIPANGTIQITLHGDFSVIANNGDINCDTGGVASGATTRTAICTYAAGLSASTTRQITIANITNPSSDGDRRNDIKTYTSASALLDRIGVMVYILQDILMTATVDPTLDFVVTGMASTTSVNGINCSANDTTASTTPFGTLTVNATSTVCQQLNVTTNADDGFTVTVEQDQELTSDSGSNINSFDNSPNTTGSTTAHLWRSPDNTLDSYHTYGHMGLTSDDQDLSTGTGYNDFYNGGGTAHYAGFNSTDPMPVMHHDGPSDGTTQSVGLTHVAYSVEVASLQEAGDYENTLTYICTPTY